MVRGQGDPGRGGRAGDQGCHFGGRKEKKKGPFSSQQQAAMGLWPCLWSVLLLVCVEWKSRVEARAAVGAGWEGRGTRVRPLDSARGLLEAHEPILWGFPKCFSRALA